MKHLPGIALGILIGWSWDRIAARIKNKAAALVASTQERQSENKPGSNPSPWL